MPVSSLAAKKKSSARDPLVQEVRRIFEREFPAAAITAYKQNSVSIRVRILDQRFAGKSLTNREKLVDHLLNSLSAEARADLTMLLLLSPEEQSESLANLEFNDPSKSNL